MALNESKKLNRKVLVGEDKETFKIIRVKDKELLKMLYDDKSLVIEAVDIAEENLNRVIDALKKEKVIDNDNVINIYVIKGTYLNNLFDIEDRLKYQTSTNIISITLSDISNISKLMQSQLRFNLGIRWMDNLLDTLANGKNVEDILNDTQNNDEDLELNVDNEDDLEVTDESIINEDLDDQVVEQNEEEIKEQENQKIDGKYAIYTNNEIYPVIKRDGKFYITRQHSKDFSFDWEFVGIIPVGGSLSRILSPENALEINDWKYKNGNPKYTIVDKDHGTRRIWGGGQKLSSFCEVNDNQFDMITESKQNKTDVDIMLEKLQSKGIKLKDLI